ncbi:ATPase (PilT family) [Candidatus Methanoperedens nitroreducens]|uniref:ATPase (PilT family) n=1 Tax=Candidatus Methanoperedens nitratireducens TaxID=1392998 RepID=A0A062VED2_9EURY|nr:PINc/VapC family ATPase [Candidatus Methanoperedens nitroreducens]KCZ73550.1 ATPase (PilT family) [Candidatus Methanoperedens nitroreducens]MDJ1422490.1 PINc/VapC family ATPase [Candidatus Methanoperedens sp.]
MSEELRLVPDTSVIIDGRITAKLKAGEYEQAIIIVPEALVSELEAQANRGREIGFKGLEELKELNEMAKRGEISLQYQGKRPSPEQVKLAPAGEIDSMIRAIAVENNAIFITSDRVQADVARAKGLNVEYLYPKIEELRPLHIEEFFTKDTLSVHLKVNVPPMAKRGTIGKQRLVKIRDEVCTDSELHDIIRELIERAKRDPDSYLELDYTGATVFQIGPMRIAAAQPPFSDGREITAVRPVAMVHLEDYRLSNELKTRIIERQRGILVAGPPGAGKSTFVAGVAEFLHGKGFIVKTMESPRDLQVPDAITQYAPLERDMAKTADILLMVRPDYTVYDEVRKTKDFHVFADMRLAGVGMVGVVHATRAVDAIQRLIGRVELGVIPQVVDTVVFIEKGEVSKVYDIEFTVKVPHGMLEQDLARPVITVADFETGEVEYEMYTYGEQVVVMPVSGIEVKRPGMWSLAAGVVKKEMQKYTRGPVDVKVVSDSSATVYMDEEDIPSVIGKGGKNIDQIEKKLGIHLDIRERQEGKDKGKGKKIEKIEISSFIPAIERSKKYVVLNVKELSGETVDVYSGDDYLFTATVGRKGDVKIGKDTEAAYRIMENPSIVTVRLSTGMG